MTKQQLIDLAKSLGIEHYNECEEFICLKGINGHASVMFTKKGANTASWKKSAKMLDFAEHLKQMGRDSLKMDLDSLLSTTRHK